MIVDGDVAGKDATNNVGAHNTTHRKILEGEVYTEAREEVGKGNEVSENNMKIDSTLDPGFKQRREQRKKILSEK